MLIEVYILQYDYLFNFLNDKNYKLYHNFTNPEWIPQWLFIF